MSIMTESEELSDGVIPRKIWHWHKGLGVILILSALGLYLYLWYIQTTIVGRYGILGGILFVISTHLGVLFYKSGNVELLKQAKRDELNFGVN